MKRKPVRKIFCKALFVLFAASHVCFSQSTFKILHYTGTSGFDHNTRQASFDMFQLLGTVNNFAVDNDSDGTSFSSVSNLQQYAVVVFANTSGDAILDSTQRSHFEIYVNSGGSYLGIHAASDTYRHSTANGSNTGTWDWYAGLCGASVQQNPNHVTGTPAYNMYKIGAHASTSNLPDPWLKNEEYYYWESGYFNPVNISVLEVEQTLGPNGQVNSYDSIRPMSWYKYLPTGGRSFYTALGHAVSNYTSDTNFINHIRDALIWAAGVAVNVFQPETTIELLNVQNPASSKLEIHFYSYCRCKMVFKIYDSKGSVLISLTENFTKGKHNYILDISLLKNGIYFLRCGETVRKFVVVQ